MKWIPELENMESNAEQGFKKDAEKGNVVEWVEEKSKDTIIEELEANLNTYQVIAEIQKFGGDVTEAINIANLSFENNLKIFETKYGASKTEIEEYRNRRDTIIKPNVESMGRTL